MFGLAVAPQPASTVMIADIPNIANPLIVFILKRLTLGAVYAWSFGKYPMRSSRSA